MCELSVLLLCHKFLCHTRNHLLVAGSAEEFNYTRMGGSTVIEGVNDRADMVETRKTFTLLGKWKYPSQRLAIFSLKQQEQQKTK